MHGCAFHLPTLSSSCLTPPFFLHLLPPLLDVSTASAPLTSNPEYELVVEANNITAEIDNEISASAIPLCLSSELTSATNHKPTQYYTTPHTHTTHTHHTHTHTTHTHTTHTHTHHTHTTHTHHSHTPLTHTTHTFAVILCRAMSPLRTQVS